MPDEFKTWSVIDIENGDVLATYDSRDTACERLTTYASEHPAMADEVGIVAYDDAGHPVSEFESAIALRGRMTHFRFDSMAWPDPTDPLEAEWALRYSSPTRQQALVAASFMAAYRQLVDLPQKARNERCLAINRALADGAGEA